MSDEPITVLAVGAGGRHEALMATVRRSPLVRNIISVPWTNVDQVADIATKSGAGFVLFDGETPLIKGASDVLRIRKIPTIGPCAGPAQVEGDKGWLASLVQDMNDRRDVEKNEPEILLPGYRMASNLTHAKRIIRKWGVPIVIKLNRPAGGKMVTVAKTIKQAFEIAKAYLAIDRIMIQKVVEGREASFIYLCAGKHARFIGVAKDNKRRDNGDKGPNTGGMGAESSPPYVTAEMIHEVTNTIVLRVLARLHSLGYAYDGFLYVGVMINEQGIWVIEFNCRHGNPEAQVLLPLIKSDIFAYILAASQSEAALAAMPPIEFKPGVAVCVCLADKNYPKEGSRLRSVVGLGETRVEARARAYAEIDELKRAGIIDSMHWRTDIAADA